MLNQKDQPVDINLGNVAIEKTFVSDVLELNIKVAVITLMKLTLLSKGNKK